jgi:hypothetical protein
MKVLFTTGYTRNPVVHHGRLDHRCAPSAKLFTIDDLAHKVRSLLDAVD